MKQHKIFLTMGNSFDSVLYLYSIVNFKMLVDFFSDKLHGCGTLGQTI